MMRRLFFALVATVFVSGMAAAQDFPRLEIFGGYSAQRLGITDQDLDSITSGMEEDFAYICDGCDSSISSSRYLKMGFEGAVTVNVNSVFGLVFDVRYNRDNIVTGDVTNGDDIDLSVKYKYEDLAVMGGPKFAMRSSERVTPFVHALFGLDHGKLAYDVSGTETYSNDEKSDGIGIAVGGGFDVNLGDTVALRLGQVDYYLTRHNEEFLKNVDFSAGIVFRFGWDY
jgi:opacity protein-like surface antigen